jgi:hypothetical protein
VGISKEQAKLTFAMARHAIVDLTQIIRIEYAPGGENRLPPETLQLLRENLAQQGLRLSSTPEAEQKLSKLRSLYEPYVQKLADRLYFDLPPWVRAEQRRDNWQGGPWDARLKAQGSTIPPADGYDHF